MEEAGRRGAVFGLQVESEFAKRCRGRKVSCLKTDVVDSLGVGHSVKSTRSAAGARLLAKSYSTIPSEWSLLKAYASARERGEASAEKEACTSVVEALRDPAWSRALWTRVMTADEPGLRRFTVYDNRGESVPEDLSSVFRSFAVEDLVELLTLELHWEVRTRKHSTVAGYADWFKPKVASISLGSTKRRLLLFTLDNLQRFLDAAEAQGKLRRLDTY